MKHHAPLEGAQQPEFVKFEQSDHSAEQQGSKNYTVKQHENTKTQQKMETMTIQSDIGLQNKRLKRDRMMRKNTAEDQETITVKKESDRKPAVKEQTEAPGSLWTKTKSEQGSSEDEMGGKVIEN